MLPNKGHLALKFHVRVERDDEGYIAYAPGWEEVYAPGDTPEQALEHLMEVALAVALSCIRHGDPIPVAHICEQSESTDLCFERDVTLPIEYDEKEVAFA